MYWQLQQPQPQSGADTTSLLASIKTQLQHDALALELIHDTESKLVHAAHYQASMTYYKLVGPPERFCDQAMRYLTYYDSASNDASSAAAATTDHVALAIDLCVAALVGQGVYHLTQIYQTPLLLQVLPSSPNAWLLELLQVVGDGNVLEFQALSQKYASQIALQPALVHGAAVVQEKLTLMALVHLVFDKPSNERTIGFDEIAARLHMSVDQVEWVVMRALSVQLLEGSMDQVDQTLQVTWVLPRVLTKPQMTALAGRFGVWADKVHNMKEYMQTTVDAAF